MIEDIAMFSKLALIQLHIDEEMEKTKSDATKYKNFRDLRISISFSFHFIKGCPIISNDKRLHLELGLIFSANCYTESRQLE